MAPIDMAPIDHLNSKATRAGARSGRNFKLFQLLALLCAGFNAAVVSANDDHPIPLTLNDTKAIITSHNWELVEWHVKKPDGEEFSYYDAVKGCHQDDQTHYHPDGTYRVTEGTESCEASTLDEVGSGLWKILEDDTGKLYISEEFLGGKEVQRSIVSIDSKRLELRSEFSDGEVQDWVYQPRELAQQTKKSTAALPELSNDQILTQEATRSLAKNSRYYVFNYLDSASLDIPALRKAREAHQKIIAITSSTYNQHHSELKDVLQQLVPQTDSFISLQPDLIIGMKALDFRCQPMQTDRRSKKEKSSMNYLMQVAAPNSLGVLDVDTVNIEKRIKEVGANLGRTTGIAAKIANIGAYVTGKGEATAVALAQSHKLVHAVQMLDNVYGDMIDPEKLAHLQELARKKKILKNLYRKQRDALEELICRHLPISFELAEVTSQSPLLIKCVGLPSEIAQLKKTNRLQIRRFPTEQISSSLTEVNNIVTSARITKFDQSETFFICKISDEAGDVLQLMQSAKIPLFAIIPNK